MYVLSYRIAGMMQRYVLPPGDTIVGRAPACDLVIDDPSMSRRHAQFSVTPGSCTVVDLASRNGTYANGSLITRAELSDGDRLILGRVPISIESSAADRLTLSENHTTLEDPSTIYRPVTRPQSVDESGATTTARSLRLLSDIARTLVTSSPPIEVFGQVVQLAFETCPAERAFLVLREEASGDMVPRIARNRDGSEIRAVTLSSTIVKRVMTERVAVLAADAQTDSRTASSDSLRLQAVRSFMCAPLWHDHDVIGVLYVDAPHAQRFTSTDLDLFTALANFAAVAIERARLNARVNEEIRRRERLERYHSAGVVKRIFESGDEADAPFFAQERDVSVLFADLVGFTALSERLTPAQTASLLNAFFERMADAIFEHEGTLDKFIGDAVMAVFGAPLDQPDHAMRAVSTAQSMQRAIAELNAESAAPPLRIRIGIHSGLARAGDIGSLRRREFTVLGDVVNIASRLESSVAKPGQVVISRATRDRLDDSIAVESLGRIALRGRQEPVEVFDASLAPGGSQVAARRQGGRSDG